VNLPDVNLPDADLSGMSLPDVNLPDVNLPDVNLPDVNLAGGESSEGGFGGLFGGLAAGAAGLAAGAAGLAGGALGKAKDVAGGAVDATTDAVGGAANATGDWVDGAALTARDAASGVTGAATDAVGNVTDTAGDWVDWSVDAAGNTVDAAGNVVSGAAESVTDTTENAWDATTGFLTDRPDTEASDTEGLPGKTSPDMALESVGAALTGAVSGSVDSVDTAASNITGSGFSLGAIGTGAAALGAGAVALGAGALGAGAAALGAGAGASATATSSTATASPASGAVIESILQEDRLFHPTEAFARNAQVKSLDDYHRLYVEAKADPEAFWAELAGQELNWFKPWSKVLDWQPPDARWFEGGKLNLSYNCLDRHLESDRRNKPAIVWEGEPGDTRVLTYAQLHREVCLFANALKSMGVGKGDVVGIYMPMVPEAAIAMLACARIGAPHSVVFGGFSAEALRDRLVDGKAKAVITADGGWRKDAIVALKDQVDRALENNAVPTVQKVMVVQRTRQPIAMTQGRDHWWHELRQTVPPTCDAEPMDSEDMLFVLYTSGSTGKPKGVVHTTAGYNLYTHMTTKWIFDLQEDDVFWCTADVGWITGHSYVVYGPLSNGATTVMYEGAPRASNPGCFWELIQKHKVSILYTAPTAIRAFMKGGDTLPKAYDMSSLRLLGTVGEPINPEAWMWYHRVIGGERCPIVDTWWQTETGGIMISALPGAIPTKPGSATRPFPGIIADVVDADGNTVADNEGGYLVIKHPWPSMMRTVYGDHDRFRRTYWEHIPPRNGQYVYFAGDGARRDHDGYFWVMGRVDDVISVAGHRLGTMEIESALVSHPAVAEAAVVGRPDTLKGEEVVAFVTLETGQRETETLVQELKAHVVQEIGALARPGEIRFTDALPKTRSGKIMRRLLRALAAGQEISGDTSTLEDRSVLDKLRAEG
jgi:acetyl-CoA synthetase